MAAFAEAEVDDVEPADLGDALLIRVGALVASHGVDGVGRADPLEERFAHEPFVGVRVLGRDAPLVAPVDVDLPPVDLIGAVAGQAFVTPPGRVPARHGHAEGLVGSTVEGLDDSLRELGRDVVDDEQLAVQRRSPRAVSSAAS